MSAHGARAATAARHRRSGNDRLGPHPARRRRFRSTRSSRFRERSRRRYRAPRLIWRQRRHRPNRRSADRRRAASASRPSPSGFQRAARHDHAASSRATRSSSVEDFVVATKIRLAPETASRPALGHAVRHQAADRGAETRASAWAPPTSSHRFSWQKRCNPCARSETSA